MTAEGAHARALEAHIRALLLEHAGRIEPGDGLPKIRARIARRPWWRRALAYFTPHSKTAAPVSAGAAEANGWKEPKDMHTLSIEERGPRGRQLAAALALAHLLESGPPMVAEWRIDGLGRLHGQPADPRDDAGSRAALEAFAEFLKAPVKRSQGRNSHEEWLHLAVVGEYRGAAVRVWAHVDVRPISPYASFGGTR